MTGSPNGPSVKPEVVFIEELLDEIGAGRLRVPRFQRPFVWNPSDMLSLFDSIYKGYPIGSLLLWESNERMQSLDKVGPFSIPEPKSTPLRYILDGHQRLATLFGGLRLLKNYARGPKQDDWRWWIWFDLGKLEGSPFVHVAKGNPDPRLLPLRAVLRTVDFLEEGRRLQAECGDQAAFLISTAEQLAQKIKNYKVATITIREGTLTQAVEIFSRLNTQGRRMEPDEMVSALTYREGTGAVNLSQRIDEILDRLGEYHFGGLKRLTVFRAILAAAEMDIHTSEWERLAHKLGAKLPATVDTAEQALLCAARFLGEELGVPGDNLLPYSHQIVMLSEFFHRCPHPSETQASLLRRWFWATSLAGWFAGANTAQISHALHEIRALAGGRVSTLKVMPLDEPARLFPAKFDMRSARIRALLIFVTSLKPLDPVTGRPIEAEPLIREYGTLPYVFNRAEGSLVSSPGNRVLLRKEPGRPPKEQLRGIRPDMRPQVLASHGIPPEAYTALIQDDARGFVEARAQHLAQLERTFMVQRGITPPREDTFGEADIDTENG